MKALLKNFLFPKNYIYNLGLCRILFYGLALEEVWAKTYLVQKFYQYQLIPRELWTPVGLFHFYPKDLVFSELQIYLLLHTLGLFLFFAMIGFFTRISACISFVLAFLFLGYPNNFGTVFDSDCLFLVTLFILIFSNMGSFLSVDNFFRKTWSKKEEEFQLFWAFWTIKLIITLVCLFYLTSAIQKLRFSGSDWFLSDHMSISFIHMGFPIGIYLSQFLLFSKFTALSGLITQILAFIPIFYSRANLLFFYLFALFHIIVDVTFGTHFNKHFIVLLFLIPWGNFLQSEKNKKLKLELFNKGFWLSFLSFLKIKKPRLKNSIILTVMSVLSFFTIFMSLYAPYIKKHLYPFSTTTMYAWIDKEPIKRRIIFVVDKDNKRRKLEKTEIWPLAYDKLFSKVKALEKEKDFEEKMRVILTKN